MDWGSQVDRVAGFKLFSHHHMNGWLRAPSGSSWSKSKGWIPNYKQTTQTIQGTTLKPLAGPLAPAPGGVKWAKLTVTTSRNASSTITPIVPTLRILQLILQVGAYSDLMKMFPSSFELLVMLVMTRISMVTTLFFAFLPLILYSYYSIISGVSHLGVSSLRGCFGVWVSDSITWHSFIYCISRFVHFSLTGSIILGPQVLKCYST